MGATELFCLPFTPAFDLILLSLSLLPRLSYLVCSLLLSCLTRISCKRGISSGVRRCWPQERESSVHSTWSSLQRRTSLLPKITFTGLVDVACAPMASSLHADVNSFILLLVFPVLVLLPLASAVDFSYPAIFNFGDSNSDTGGLMAAGIQDQLLPPNGQTYFGKPSGRFSDGRLIVDYLMDSMDMPFLNSYLESIGAPSFQKGCNFAVAASTILPATATSISPFSFGVQVAQFLRFKSRVLQLLARGNKFKKYIPQSDFFGQGLYMFDIGQNDLAGAFYSKTEDQVIASIPTILLEFEKNLKKLYDQGARRFWIHNTGPLGCLPENIAYFGKDPSKLDENGCVASHNRAARLFNLQLHALCTKLQGSFADANVTYVDIFSIKSNLIANYSRYGFEKSTAACCGFGGPPLNYDSRISCGQTKIVNGSSVTASACDDASEYVNWDGIHYTDAANLHISSQILTGKYSDPPFSDKMPFAIKLKF